MIINKDNIDYLKNTVKIDLADQLMEAAKADESNKQPVKMATITPPANNPSFSMNALITTINDIPKMNNNEIRMFVINNFASIVQNVFSNEDSNKYIKCFTNPAFLDGFIEAISNQRVITNDMIIKINNICYDYISLKGQKDPVIINRMIAIGNLINRINIPRLLGLGLNHDLASILLIARFSSFDLDIVVRRVNLIIITQPKTLMSYDMIMQIFRVLYGDYKLWGDIFQYFMLDVIPQYDEENNNAVWVSEEVEEINSTINLVILQILNETPTGIITQALYNYAGYYSMYQGTKPVRFSLRTLSGDYGRILTVINYLQWTENIYVP